MKLDTEESTWLRELACWLTRQETKLSGGWAWAAEKRSGGAAGDGFGQQNMESVSMEDFARMEEHADAVAAGESSIVAGHAQPRKKKKGSWRWASWAWRCRGVNFTGVFFSLIDQGS
ncbi:hypothetical protein ACJRO7_020278 [Eucalyptus globulus]|uniref:Uncharacterized protein n=1 Tax=Eucalyptus globulus TaxID=34317 RepID=A0ABD3KG12_EUCGL